MRRQMNYRGMKIKIKLLNNEKGVKTVEYYY